MAITEEWSITKEKSITEERSITEGNTNIVISSYYIIK